MVAALCFENITISDTKNISSKETKPNKPWWEKKGSKPGYTDCACYVIFKIFLHWTLLVIFGDSDRETLLIREVTQ